MNRNVVWLVVIATGLSIAGLLLAQSDSTASPAKEVTKNSAEPGRWTIEKVSVPQWDPDLHKSVKGGERAYRNAPGDAVLLDTATGKTWLLRHNGTSYAGGDAVDSWAWFPLDMAEK